MNSWACVALGGAAGAVARFAVSGRLGTVGGSGFPLGTLAVNVLGCLVIGYLLGFGESRDWLGERARWFLVTGFLGSFTTFSTFGHETLSLVERGHSMAAAGYVAASLAASGVAVLVGVWSAKQFG
ncbi:MAG: fluoride efflux transporter CrcB [Planctomycetota bacterium]|nr:fluoride efflux transporter CrcB [Planctomycetota bacterium]